MDQDILFKTAPFGFDKQDVIDYIEQLQTENRQLKEQIQKLKAGTSTDAEDVPYTFEDIRMDPFVEAKPSSLVHMPESQGSVQLLEEDPLQVEEPKSDIDRLEEDMVRAMEKAEAAKPARVRVKVHRKK